MKIVPITATQLIDRIMLLEYTQISKGAHLVLEGDLVGLEMPGLLRVLVQHSQSRYGRPIQKLDVNHHQLLQSNAEGLVQIPLRVHRDYLHVRCTVSVPSNRVRAATVLQCRGDGLRCGELSTAQCLWLRSRRICPSKTPVPRIPHVRVFTIHKATRAESFRL